MIANSCCFTGHRPARFHWKYDEEHPDCVKLKLLIENQIVRMAEAGVTTFISGMAQGADQWAALSVLKLKMDFPLLRLVCALPCETQTAGWSADAKMQYADILNQSDTAFYVSQEYSRNCMILRNQWMVDSSKYVLAVYDGGYRGGTAQTVRYATKMERAITLIHPDTLVISFLPVMT